MYSPIVEIFRWFYLKLGGALIPKVWKWSRWKFYEFRAFLNFLCLWLCDEGFVDTLKTKTGDTRIRVKFLWEMQGLVWYGCNIAENRWLVDAMVLQKCVGFKLGFFPVWKDEAWVPYPGYNNAWGGSDRKEPPSLTITWS